MASPSNHNIRLRFQKQAAPSPGYCHICLKQHTHVVVIYACNSCIPANIRNENVPEVFSCASKCEWECAICAATLAEMTISNWFHTCIACLLDDHAAASHELKTLDFLQAQIDPSPKNNSFNPLSDDFKGDISFVVKGSNKLKRKRSDECVQAHRFILANKSRVFKAMMETDMKEKLMGTIDLEGISAPVVRAAVNFMYVGKIDFSDQVPPEDVLGFADFYEIGLLKETCEKELVKKITIENAAKMYAVSHKFRSEMLKDEVIMFLKDHPNDFETMLDHFL